MIENYRNRIVLIGNGFDLAHGLKTSYKDFIDWYMCNSFNEFIKNGNYRDQLIEIFRDNPAFKSIYKQDPKNAEEVLQFIDENKNQSIKYESKFYKELLVSFCSGSWVDIECKYFDRLKNVFNNSGLSNEEKKRNVEILNRQFNYLIQILSNYINYINSEIYNYKKLSIGVISSNIGKAFKIDDNSPVTFLNFNYTDTLLTHGYANENEIIYIHGRVADQNKNPIIFGYGDETDSVYQQIEDSGENVYLEHIKSFGYLQTDNYNKLISLIDSAPFIVYIVGHSCGLSDRILLNEIFEHPNCQRIEIFFHKRKDGSDNFKQITQEISRHFKPQNKKTMRRRVANKNERNIIPQNG